MKHFKSLMGIALIICGAAWSQDTGERVVVPARNSTRPRKVDVNIMGGAIVVKSYAGKEVIVEATGAGRETRRTEDKRAEGMHRIDLPARGLSVEEQDNVVTVRTSNGGRQGTITIQVPQDTSLTLRTMSGSIDVEGVKGELDVNSMNGPIKLTHVSGTVLAHSMNGAMTISMDQVDQTKPLSFSTMNGTIDVTLPPDFKANAKIKTDHGEVYSDFDFKLGGGTVTQKNDTSDGKFKVKMDSTIQGTINGGGTEATFKTYNGTIYLRKRK